MKRKLITIIAAVLVIATAAGAAAIYAPGCFASDGKSYKTECTAAAADTRSEACLENDANTDCGNTDSNACGTKADAFDFGYNLNVTPKTFRQRVSDFITKFFSVFGKDNGTSCPADSSEPKDTAQPDTTQSTTTAPAETSKPSTSAPETTKPAASAPQTSAPASSLSYEQQVAALVNAERAKYGLSPLTLNTKLSDVARTKSQDMHDNRYFSHDSPTFGTTFNLLKTNAISYRTAGENIAMGYKTPQEVMNGWMNSSGHRANILSSSFTQIGVGYVADGSYWTQVFIG